MAQSLPTEQFDQLLETTQDAILSITLPDRRLIYKSTSFEQVYGCDVQAFLDDPRFAHQFVHPDDLPLALAAEAAALRYGFAELDHRVVLPSGEVRWLHRRARVLFDAEQRPIQVIDTARDITARKTAEEALRHSAQSLQQQKSFLEILLSISTQLITTPAHRLGSVIQITLGEIGTFLGADRMHIVEYDFAPSSNPGPYPNTNLGTNTATVTYEWRAPGIESHIQDMQAVPFAGMEDWVARHRRGEPVQISNTDDLDPADPLRKILAALGVQSLLAIPLLEDGACGGFVGLHAVGTPRSYGESDQQLLGLFAELLVNIRSRVKTLAALEASEQRYRQIVETAQEGIWMIDLDGRTLYANQRMANMLSYSLAELTGANFFFFMDAEARRQAEYYLEGRRQGIQEQHDFRFVRKDGSDLWVIINTNPILDGSGRPISVLGMLTDITARKQAEAALQEANRLLEERIAQRTAELQQERSLLLTVVNAIPDFIYIKDRQHHMVLNNLAHTEFIGRTTPAELVGKTDLDLFPAALAHQYLADEEHLFATGEPVVDREEPSIRADGSEVWMLSTKMPLYNAAGEITGLTGITRDITARKAAEAAAAAALAREKELGELKSRLVSMASHEFRNPLAAILTTAETLALMWERMDKAKIDDRLQRICDQALRLTAITEDVLQFTRLQTGRSKFAPAQGDLDELVTRLVSDLAELPGNQGRLRYDCAQRPLQTIFDAHLMQQAIGNLLHNALKYSPPDKAVHITLAQLPHEDTGQITLRIADAGIGIPPEDLPHLFEPFRRAANVGAIQGTGLGLAIAKEAVELHGGTIAVESQVGVGTTFTVTLPRTL